MLETRNELKRFCPRITSNSTYIIIFFILSSQISSEKDEITVPLSVAKMSKMVCDSIAEEDEDEISDPEFEILKVTTEVLQQVVEYCTHYQTVEKMNAIEIPFKDDEDTVLKIVKQKWYSDFVDKDFKSVNKLIAAANYMNISPLLDLACLAESVYIRGKSAEALRGLYNIEDPQANNNANAEEKNEE